MKKKYVSLSKLSDFLDNLKRTFANITHKHTTSDITDYKVDDALSSNSTNPVQNKVLDAEFEAISVALDVYDTALDNKTQELQNKIDEVASIQDDWNQTDETQSDFIKNKISLENGEATKSIRQSGDEAISESAIAFGVGTLAGLKGFDIIGWDSEHSTYTLSSALPEEIQVGATFCANIKTNYYNAGTILSISDDRLTIETDNYIDVQAAIDADGLNVKKNIWFIDYPDAGDIDLGSSAIAIGDGSQAIQTGALAAGRDVKAVGKYSTALGRDTTAWYAGLATGYKSEATGLYSTALGYRAAAKGDNSVAIGDRVIASEPCQVVVGKSNIEDKDAVFIIGNGITAPSNALTVNKDGTTKVVNVEATKNISAVGSISSTKGGISAAGAIKAGSTIEAGAGIKTGASSDFGGSIRINKGSLDVKTGSISTGETGGITAGTNGIKTTGKISTSTNIAADGSVTAGGAITASGDINARAKVNTSNITSTSDIALNAKNGSNKVVVGADGSFKYNDKEVATQEYAYGVAQAVKNDLLNGAGGAYDTLKELGDLIDDNTDAIEALEKIAAGKADKEHEHEQYITEVPDKVSAFENDAGYISNIPAEYITESELLAKHYATEEYVDDKFDKSDGVDGSSLVGKELFHLDFDDNFNSDKSLKNTDTYIVMGDARSIYMFSDGTLIHYVIIPMNKEVSSKDSEYAYFEVDSVEGLSASSKLDFYYNRRFENGVWTQSSGQITFTASDDGFIAKVPVEFLDRWIYTDSKILYTLFEGYEANTYSMKRTDNFDCQGIVTNIVYNSSTNKSTLTVTNAQPITSVAYEGIDLWFPYQPLAGDFSESQGAYSVGADNIVCGFNGFAAGFNNIVYSDYGTATGRYNKVTYGGQAHGQRNEAMGQWSVALGHTNKATGLASIALGRQNEATENYSTAIGYKCKSTGKQSIALGHTTTASGAYAFTSGHQTNAAHNYSSAFGVNTKTGREYQMVIGRNNAVDTGALFVVGNGSSASSPKNVFTVAASDITAAGNFTAAGKITSGDNGIETSGKIHTSANLAVDGNATVTGIISSKNRIVADDTITGKNMYITANGSNEVVATKNYVDSLNLLPNKDKYSVQQKGCTATKSHAYSFGGYNLSAVEYNGSLGYYNTSGGYMSLVTGSSNSVVGSIYTVSPINIKAVTVGSTSYKAFVDASNNYITPEGYTVIAYNTKYSCYVPVRVLNTKDSSNVTFYYISGDYNFNKPIYAHDINGTRIANISEINGFSGGYQNGSGSFTAGAHNIIAGASWATALGSNNIIGKNNQTVVGTYNDPKTDALFIVGGGGGESSRKNAFTVDKNGNTVANGKITATSIKTTGDISTSGNLRLENGGIIDYSSQYGFYLQQSGTSTERYITYKSTASLTTGLYAINISINGFTASTMLLATNSGEVTGTADVVIWDGGAVGVHTFRVVLNIKNSVLNIRTDNSKITSISSVELYKLADFSLINN